MHDGQDFPGATDIGADGQTAMVRVGTLYQFAELVTELGGDWRGLLARAQLDPAMIGQRHAVLPYRTLVHLLERASSELACPDFGMRLAALQARGPTLGPLHVAMRHSPTLGDALRYCVSHARAFSSGAQLSLEERREEGTVFLRFEIVLARLPYQRQTLEHALALIRWQTHEVTAGRVLPREIGFTHQPQAPLSAYRGHLGCAVRFGCSMNGIAFAERDLSARIADADPWLYELANSFIEQRFPTSEQALSARVRGIVERLLLEGECSFGAVAARLGMHTRTLQRRLRVEGESFESIRDSVRRDVALRYLCQSELPLTRVAELLGYSETSVLSRSCYRWFAASPRQLRSGRHHLAML